MTLRAISGPIVNIRDYLLLKLEILIKNNAENRQKMRDSMEKLPARKKAAWDNYPIILHILDV